MSNPARVRCTPPTNTTRPQPRVHLSRLMRDPFVRDAFERAERDLGDDFGEIAEADHPNNLDGGAAEVIGDTGRHVWRAEP